MLTAEYEEIPYTAPTQLYNGMLRFKPSDKKLYKTLKKKSLVIVHTDSLYINLRHLSYQGFGFDGNGYVQAWLLPDSTLLFFAPDTGWKAFGKELGIGLGSAVFTLGMSGGTFYAVPWISNWAIFIYRGGKKVDRIDRKEGIELLAKASPSLYDEYMSLPEHERKQKKTMMFFLYALAHEQCLTLPLH